MPEGIGTPWYRYISLTRRRLFWQIKDKIILKLLLNNGLGFIFNALTTTNTLNFKIVQVNVM